MRILYAAIDQAVPGATGGSVHVAAVAEGLAALGHDVDAVATPGNGPFPSGSVHWHAEHPPLGARQLRLLRTGRLKTLARALQPDVVIERYYNFGGEAVLAAQDIGALLVLEVNAPVIDYPGSPKRWLDRALVVEPMRRWREWQCARAALMVTPSRAILPDWIRSERILEIEWGADTTRFHPGATGPIPFTREPGDTVVVFAGAFRTWHGAIHLVRAVGQLRARGRHDIKAVFVGDGPELERVRRAAASITGITMTGELPHSRMPTCLAAADIGVAPFDVRAHAPLALAFYWSPLKVFEYMAAGLPVVVPDVARLRQVVHHEHEGLLYDPSDPTALSFTLERLADVVYRTRLGAAARARAVREFGWDTHCRKLDEAIRACRSAS